KHHARSWLRHTPVRDELRSVPCIRKGCVPFNSSLLRLGLREHLTMDAIIKNFPSRPAETEAADVTAYMNKPVADRPSREEAEAAVRTLLRWIGDDPDREGLIDTPKRVATSFREIY